MTKKNIIVTITDCCDVAANEIHGTLFQALSELKVLDKVEIAPIVRAKNFSIVNGAFLVRLMADNYPPQDTIFLIILNPLRTDRKERARLIGETRNGFKFVGANTGTLSWLLKDFGVKSIYESSTAGLNGRDFISFGGKHIHAPIAARIAAGIPLEKLGQPISADCLTYIELKVGTIIHIDNFGIAKIYGRCPKAKEGDAFKININGKPSVKAIFSFAMKNLEENTWVIFPGSSLNKLPEFGLTRGNGAKKLNLKIGDEVAWEKVER